MAVEAAPNSNITRIQGTPSIEKIIRRSYSPSELMVRNVNTRLARQYNCKFIITTALVSKFR
jgi:hypothetical protein